MKTWDHLRIWPLSAVLLAGCGGPPSKPVSPATETASSHSATAAAQEPVEPQLAVEADNAESVQALAAIGVILKKDAAGNVVSADAKPATISDDQMGHFAGLKSLKSLSLENGQISDAGLDVLEHLPHLTELNLRRCSSLTADALARLKYVPQLERLHLLYTNIPDQGLEHLAVLKNLKVLDLRGCKQMGNAGLKHLSGLTSLIDLKLRTPSVDNTGIAHLAGLVNLKYLALEDCGIDNKGMPSLEGLNKLTHFNAMRTYLGDEGLKSLSDNKLVDLRLRDTVVLGPGLDFLEASRPTLEYLDLSETRITNDGLAKVAPFTRLKTLSVWNGSFDDSGVALLTGLTDLEDFDAQGCRLVTSASAEHFLKLPKLRVLNVAETGFDDDGLAQLAKLASLKTVKVSRSNITDAGIEAFQKARPDVEIDRGF